MLVLATLGARERRFPGPIRKQRKAQPEPDPRPVATTRATIVEVATPLDGPEHATAWLTAAGETELGDGLAVLNRALHAYRIASADPPRAASAARTRWSRASATAPGSRWPTACGPTPGS